MEGNFEAAIKTFNLSKRFPLKSSAKKRSEKRDISAVSNVSLEIGKGELFGLLGPNGAGKTTLIKMLCTLVLPTSGTAIVNGFDIVRDQRKVRESVGLIPGEIRRTFYYRLSGRQNLEFFATLYSIPRIQTKERIRRLLELVELESWADEKVMRYSTGMMQRLGIARGLLHDPPILLMDEPTVGLDPRSARAIRDFVRNELNEQGKTILLTTHYMEEADQLCNQVAIMDGGKIVIVDDPAAMKKLVKEEDIIELEVSNIIPRIEDEIKIVEGVKRVLVDLEEQAVGHGKIRIHTTDSRIVLPHVIENIVENGGKVVSFKTSDPTLEDVFMKFTGRGLA